jgi:hypothetical protein
VLLANQADSDPYLHIWTFIAANDAERPLSPSDVGAAIVPLALVVKPLPLTIARSCCEQHMEEIFP